MTQYDKDFNFHNVLDSERAKEKRLVEPQLDSEDLRETIPIGPASSSSTSQPKILTNQYQKNGQNSFAFDAKSYDLNKASHPIICIFTFAFKLSSFIMYLIVGNFISNILTFIFVLVLSSMDFWFVKNISGRLLVGLRWRSTYDSKGKQVWKFQSYNQEFTANKVDKLFFWASQFVFTAIWGVLLLLNILTISLFWSLLLVINFGLCGTNLYGYYQCHGDHKKKLNGLKKQYGKKVFNSIAERVL